MRRTVTALVALVVLLTAGCAGGGGDAVPGAAEALDAWAERGPASYTYTLTSECGERALVGVYAVTVSDAAVTAVEPLDEVAGWSMPAAQEYVPTIAELLERILDEPATVREATFDDDGVPTHVFFDREPNAIDDEECYDLTNVRPAG